MRNVILVLMFLVGVTASAGEKQKAPSDTLVSRTAYIQKLKNDIQRVENSKKEADQMLLVLQGQVWMLELQTQDSIRVKK